jgi:hypothetical protein
MEYILLNIYREVRQTELYNVGIQVQYGCMDTLQGMIRIKRMGQGQGG